jgi:regulatory protein
MKKIKSIYKKRFSNNFFYVNYEVDKSEVEKSNIDMSEDIPESLNSEKSSDEIHLDLIVKYKLTKGRVIEDAEYSSIKKEIDFYYFKAKALRYTERGGKTKKELEQKLRSVKCNSEIISKITSQFIEYGFINDDIVAERYKEMYLKANKSNNYIKNKLYSKGIDKHIIDSLFLDYNKEYELQAVILLIQKLIKNKAKKLNSLPNRQKQEQYIIQHLSMNGFGFEVIKKAIQNTKNELNEINEVNEVNDKFIENNVDLEDVLSDDM